MLKKLLAVFAFVLLITPAIAQQGPSLLRGPRPVIDLNQVPASAMESGKLSIKFKPVAQRLLQPRPAVNARGIVQFGIAAIDQLNSQYGVTAASRVFETILSDKIHQIRHEAWGLNLWYQLEFPASQPVKEVIAAYRALGDLVEVVEPVYKIQRVNEVPPLSGQRVTFTPNDTQFGNQWHYDNTGQQGGTAGRDIRLVQAWDIATGDSNVVVGVVDGAIQTHHPDLAGNIWYGKGYNFVNNSPILDSDLHATHVAGTIAAVNNNGLGVSGVAGGNGTPGSGVHLMSLEIFGPSASAGNVGAVYVWSADHGAAISQNSWSYNSPNVYQQSVLDGIDYFIANGGGTVLNGGLVVVAAGNNSSGLPYYPASYPRVISVAATNNKDVRSYYSNFGSFVDISAPGGEQSFANDPHGVLSTENNSTYGYLQGTSMACPHVSGVAALVVSEAPGRLSADDVRSILLSTTDNHYPYNLITYAGKLGTGRLNAYKALLLTQQIASLPVVMPVTNTGVSISCPNVHLSWTKNPVSDDVMIAYKASGEFGVPQGHYSVGDTIAGGGVVIYQGSADAFDFPIVSDSLLLQFKIWSVSGGNHYSLGQVMEITTPFSLVSLDGVESGPNIQLSWVERCPSSDVIIASNSTAVFGTPSGNLQPGDNLPGGGKVIFKGHGTDFLFGSPVTGTNYFRMWAVNSDSVYSPFYLDAALCYGSIDSALNQGFEPSLFPPAGWQVRNPDAASFTWERNTVASSQGSASVVLQCYAYPEIGQQDYLLSPPINAVASDSIIFSFDRAYRQYDNDYADTLELVVSTDCGASFMSVWKKGGSELATVPGSFTSTGYIAAAADWKNLRLDLKPYVGSASRFIAGFRSTNRFGQNIFLDNIHIEVIKIPANDAGIIQLASPEPRVCDLPASGQLKLRNFGRDTLSSVMIYFAIDGGAPDSIAWTGALAPADETLVNFSDFGLSLPSLPYGAHQMLSYTALPNGFTDGRQVNDSLLADFALLQEVPVPFNEGFESAAIPGDSWTVSSSKLGYTWERETRAAKDGQAGVWIRNFRFDAAGAHDDLYSPLLQTGTADSVYLNFDVAHATRTYPGNTNHPFDTLEVWISTDCGKTSHLVYKKAGYELSTIGPNFPQEYDPGDTIGFVPTATQWRNEWIDITSLVPDNSRFLLMFRNTGNGGNNIYLDNVKVSTVTLPQRLKEEGYQITPNPFQSSFRIRHVGFPVHLRGIQVTNAAGQVLLTRSYQGNASSIIDINMSKYGSGMYQVKLIYNDKVITERIIKLP